MKVGIDLGTTYSLIARLGNDGKPLLVPDHAHKDVFATPSVVHLDGHAAMVGYLVDILLERNPEMSALRFFKRNLGETKPVFIDKNGNQWYPEGLCALVLKKLRFDLESSTGKMLGRAVITVPAHFNDIQRKSVLDAAHIADIPILGLVEEPVAAALHYGITHKRHDQIIAVYDLGGGTFDASIISLDEKGVYVLAKDGITNLGGKDFDEHVADYILRQFERSPDGIPELNAYTLLQLRRIAEEVKIELSAPNITFLRKRILLGHRAMEILFNRRDFEVSIREAIEKTIETTVRCVDAAGISMQDVDSLLLVGGSSMIPYVRERLRNLFPEKRQQIYFHEPMKAVAFGAAIHASQLGGDAEKYDIPPVFRGITGHYLGVRTIDAVSGRISIDVLIKKNMPLPSKSTRSYFTTSSSQNRVVLELVQYMDNPTNAITVGELVVGPLPNPRPNYQIEVTVEYTDDGLIRVSAYDPNTGVELNQTFGNPEHGAGHLLRQKKLVQDILINNVL